MTIRLNLMQFKDFIWPNNPETYNIRFEKRIVKHSYIGINQEEVENMGMDARVMSGSGVFFGPIAYETFQRLATVFYNKEPGILYHPIWMNANVFFTKLEVRNQPLPDYVEYDFEFVQHVNLNVITEVTSNGSSTPTTGSGSSSTTNSVYHIVKQGETLSGIGQKYGVPWKQIAEDNKSLIKNPNLIQIGWKLKINSPKKSTTSTKSNSSSSSTTSKKGTGDVAYDRFMETFGDRLGKEEL